MYHIEKFGFPGEFHRASLGALANIVSSLKFRNPGLEVIGFSAICVTADGIRLFHDKLSFRERGFIIREHIIRKNGRVEIFTPGSQEDLTNKLNQGYEHVTRCKMLVSLPGEPSIVWKIMGQKQDSPQHPPPDPNV